MMKNLNDMMKQVQQLQTRMQEVQARLENLSIEGKAGGDLVKVTLNGKGIMIGIVIDSSLLKPEEKEIVEDLVIAAYADARAKMEAAVAEEMKQVTGGIPLPPGFQLPF
jgi:DNA-binding YbaB/EbfC family protein